MKFWLATFQSYGSSSTQAISPGVDPTPAQNLNLPPRTFTTTQYQPPNVAGADNDPSGVVPKEKADVWGRA